MTWLLDADVLSQAAKRKGDPRVIGWLEREEARCHTSTVVIAQLTYWVRSKEGKSREALQKWLRQLLDAMEGRVLGFSVFGSARLGGAAARLGQGRPADAPRR